MRSPRGLLTPAQPPSANSSATYAMSCFFQAVTWLLWLPNRQASWAVVRSPLAAASAAFASNAAQNTLPFPAIILLLKARIRPGTLRLIRAPENQGPPQSISCYCRLLSCVAADTPALELRWSAKISYVPHRVLVAAAGRRHPRPSLGQFQ